MKVVPMILPLNKFKIVTYSLIIVTLVSQFVVAQLPVYQKLFGNGLSDAKAYALEEGGYVVAATLANDINNNIVIYRVSISGDIGWQYELAASASDEVFIDIGIRNGIVYILATSDFDGNITSILLTLNVETGDALDAFSFGNSSDNFPVSITFIDDNSLAILCQTLDGGIAQSFEIISINSDFDIISQATYSSELDDATLSVTDFVANEQGEFIITGNLESDIIAESAVVFISIDAASEDVLSANYLLNAEGGYLENINDILYVPGDNKYYLTGTAQLGEISHLVYYKMFEVEENIYQNSAYSFSIFEQDMAIATIEALDYGFITVGYGKAIDDENWSAFVLQMNEFFQKKETEVAIFNAEIDTRFNAILYAASEAPTIEEAIGYTAIGSATNEFSEQSSYLVQTNLLRESFCEESEDFILLDDGFTLFHSQLNLPLAVEAANYEANDLTLTLAIAENYLATIFEVTDSCYTDYCGYEEVVWEFNVFQVIDEDSLMLSCADFDFGFADFNIGVEWSEIAWYSINDTENPISTDLSVFIEASDTLIVQAIDLCGVEYIDTIFAYVDDNCVYPGDVNIDGIVNMDDLLDWGLVPLDIEGPPRFNDNIFWLDFFGYPALNWEENQPFNAVNQKHTDCDGNGVKTLDDLVAITTNFEHTNLYSSGKNEILEETTIFIEPTNTGDIGGDGEIGDSLRFNIILSNTDGDELDAYGLRFDVTYSPQILPDTGKVLNITTDFSESWLGTDSTDMIGLFKTSLADSIMNVGITRLNQINQTGSGTIAKFGCLIEVDILGVYTSNPAGIGNDGKTYDLLQDEPDEYVPVNRGLENIRLINNNNEETVLPDTSLTLWVLPNYYCVNQGFNTSDEWIEAVSIDTTTNTSGNNNGYIAFSNIFASLIIGENHQLSLEPGFTDEAFTEVWRIWIDYNQNKIFDEATELVFINEEPSNTNIVANFNVPEDAIEGVTKMRVSMTYYDPTDTEPLPDVCTAFTYGETEDYRVRINARSSIPVTNPLKDFGLFAYPLPAQSILYVNFQSNIYQQARISILNTLGNVIQQQNIDAQVGINQIQLDVASLQAACYFVVLEIEGKLVVQKVIKI